ncbi:hypothetical protein R6Q59_035987 [Mikania micrantha]
MKTSMKRLPLEFDFQTRRVISETNSAFMHECDYIVRNNCSFQFKDWRLVPNEVRMPLRYKLTENAKKKVEARRNRKMDSINGQIDTWRHTHWDEEKGWISEDAAATYEDMIKLRKQHSVESLSDKLILEMVLGQSFVRLHGWGRDPTICSNTTCTNQKLKHPTCNELVNEVETLKETCEIMQKILLEKNLMSPLPGPSQDDTSESDENEIDQIGGVKVLIGETGETVVVVNTEKNFVFVRNEGIVVAVGFAGHHRHRSTFE